MTRPNDPPPPVPAAIAIFAMFANFEGCKLFIKWQHDDSGTLRPAPPVNCFPVFRAG